MSSDPEKGVINPISSKSAVEARTDSVSSTIVEEDYIICGGVLLTDFVTKWRLVRKIRAGARPATEWSNIILCVRYLAMAFGRVMAFYGIFRLIRMSTVVNR